MIILFNAVLPDKDGRTISDSKDLPTDGLSIYGERVAEIWYQM